uniref:Uncharacterized protein n=1 Tax=Strombidium inclinatum TaxID=197538 RepID=A0A7S3IPN9_9SPIT|mmetsp:Transcript_32475/g.49696  ORF Transcript_32475/g.49696 Transcript_32475/m.49696 type:complete len:119 (+) Transcript_32475:410-766(+)
METSAYSEEELQELVKQKLKDFEDFQSLVNSFERDSEQGEVGVERARYQEGLWSKHDTVLYNNLPLSSRLAMSASKQFNLWSDLIFVWGVLGFGLLYFNAERRSKQLNVQLCEKIIEG